MQKTPKSTPARTPTVMEVDSDDDEITLKTPPNITKVKSRSNSRATSNAGTPTLANAEKSTNLAKGLLEKLAEKKLAKASTPKIGGNQKTPSTPKMKKK